MSEREELFCIDRLQRERVMSAMVAVVAELGYSRTTVEALCADARISRPTFYKTFDSLQACFLAVMDEGYVTVRGTIAQAFEGEERWLDELRGALASLLVLFDSETALARVLFVEVLAAGAWALERRERHLRALRAMMLGRWSVPAASVSPLAAAGVMDAVLGLIHGHILAERSEPLVGRLGPLVGLVVAPYLSERAAKREIERADALARSLLTKGCPPSQRFDAALDDLPGLLRDPRAHRARACLLYLVANPGASNRQIARAMGVAGSAQISTMLARLHGLKLLCKQSAKPGGVNAWTLTDTGARAANTLVACKRTVHVHPERPFNLSDSLAV